MSVVERWPNSGGSTVQVEGAKKIRQQQLIRLKGVSFMLHSFSKGTRPNIGIGSR